MKKFLNIFLVFVFIFTGACIAQAYQPIKKTTPNCSTAIMKNYRDPVIFNTNSRKWHEPSCRYSSQCTNAYYMERSEAKQKGVPCKVCH